MVFMSPTHAKDNQTFCTEKLQRQSTCRGRADVPTREWMKIAKKSKERLPTCYHSQRQRCNEHDKNKEEKVKRKPDLRLR